MYRQNFFEISEFIMNVCVVAYVCHWGLKCHLCNIIEEVRDNLEIRTLS